MLAGPSGIGVTAVPVRLFRGVGESLSKERSDERTIQLRCEASMLPKDGNVICRPTESAKVLRSRRARFEIAPANKSLRKKRDVVRRCNPEIEVPVAGDGQATVSETNIVEDGPRNECLRGCRDEISTQEGFVTVDGDGLLVTQKGGDLWWEERIVEDRSVAELDPIHYNQTRSRTASCRSHLKRQLVRLPEVISIQESQEVAARESDACVARTSNALVLLADKAYTVGKGGSPVAGAIQGAVIDYDGFIVLECLVEDALDRRRDVSLMIVGGDNHADEWRHGYAGPVSQYTVDQAWRPSDPTNGPRLPIDARPQPSPGRVRRRTGSDREAGRTGSVVS